jgi:hypothetical protein
VWVQKHQLIAFRRIAAKVYKKNLKWKKAVNMATKDGLFVDAMETASQSSSPQLVTDLLSFFIEVCPSPSCLSSPSLPLPFPPCAMAQRAIRFKLSFTHCCVNENLLLEAINISNVKFDLQYHRLYTPAASLC